MSMKKYPINSSDTCFQLSWDRFDLCLVLPTNCATEYWILSMRYLLCISLHASLLVKLFCLLSKKRGVQNSLTKVVQYSFLALQEIFLYKAMREAEMRCLGLKRAGVVSSRLGSLTLHRWGELLCSVGTWSHGSCIQHQSSGPKACKAWDGWITAISVVCWSISGFLADSWCPIFLLVLMFGSSSSSVVKALML